MVLAQFLLEILPLCGLLVVLLFRMTLSVLFDIALVYLVIIIIIVAFALFLLLLILVLGLFLSELDFLLIQNWHILIVLVVYMI